MDIVMEAIIGATITFMLLAVLVVILITPIRAIRGTAISIRQLQAAIGGLLVIIVQLNNQIAGIFLMGQIHQKCGRKIVKDMLFSKC